MCSLSPSGINYTLVPRTLGTGKFLQLLKSPRLCLYLLLWGGEKAGSDSSCFNVVSLRPLCDFPNLSKGIESTW
jgi:hypothetical protein